LIGLLLATFTDVSQPESVATAQTLDDAIVAVGALSEPAPPHFETLGRTTHTTAIVLTASRLELIDLDTAQRDVFPLDRTIGGDTLDMGRRILVQGGALLVPGGLTTWSIDLATGQVSDVGPGDRVAPALTEGNAWIWTTQAATWREINGAHNTLREMSSPGAGIHWDHGAGTPELTAAPGGGIYKLQGNGQWRIVTSGVPLAVNNDTALLQDCASLEACDYRWVDLDTGTELDRQLPPSIDRPTSRRYRLSPSGESILEMNPTNRSWQAVFVYRNSLVRGTSCMRGWDEASWSNDESLLACAIDRGVAVSDVRNGSAAIFDDWDEPPLAVVLVDTELAQLGR
jgi:hypothetical protein